MSPTWVTASEPWTSTRLRYAWEATTQWCCTTHARTPSWRPPSSWTSSSLLSCVRGLKSKQVSRWSQVGLQYQLWKCQLWKCQLPKCQLPKCQLPICQLWKCQHQNVNPQMSEYQLKCQFTFILLQKQNSLKRTQHQFLPINFRVHGCTSIQQPPKRNKGHTFCTYLQTCTERTEPSNVYELALYYYVCSLFLSIQQDLYETYMYSRYSISASTK